MVSLSEVAKIERIGVDPKRLKRRVQYIGLEHIDGADGSVESVEINSDELSSTKFQFDDGHVLYGKLRPYLAKVTRPHCEGICSTDILPIRPGPRIDAGYLFRYLREQSVVALASSLATGANLPRLSPKLLEQILIPLPPIEEQRRIAAILDQVDALRRARRRALTRLNDLAQAIFYEMFGDPISNSKGWSLLALGDLLVHGPQNGIYKPASSYGVGTRILRIDAFYDGRITDPEALRRLALTPAEENTYKLFEDDIVINRVNSIEYLGKSTIIPALREPTVFESNMMRFRVDETKLLPGYLIEFLQTPFIKAQIRTSTKDAVNQSSINQQDVKAFLVCVPPIELQRDFVVAVQRVDSTKVSQLLSLSRLDTLFASLQQRAFCGELQQKPLAA